MIRSSFRLARQAPRFVRTYAEAASPDKLKLSFTLPYRSINNQDEVTQVNLPTTAGTIGVLANHVPTLEELTPGVVEVITGAETKQYFIAGGFASIGSDSILNVNAVDAYPLEDISASEAKNLLSTAQKNAASSDKDVALQGKIETELLEALVAVAK